MGLTPLSASQRIPKFVRPRRVDHSTKKLLVASIRNMLRQPVRKSANPVNTFLGHTQNLLQKQLSEFPIAPFRSLDPRLSGFSAPVTQKMPRNKRLGSVARQISIAVDPDQIVQQIVSRAARSSRSRGLVRSLFLRTF